MKKNILFGQTRMSNKQFFSNKLAFLLIVFSEVVKMFIFKNWYNMPGYTDGVTITIFCILTVCELTILIWKIINLIKEKNPWFIWKLFWIIFLIFLIIALSFVLFWFMSFKSLAG